MTNRADIRLRARILADQVGIGGPATKPDDTSYNYWIDEACKEVWGDLVQAGWPVDYTTATITANGNSTYTVGPGTGIFSVQGVFFQLGTDFYEVRRVNQADIAQLRSQTAQSNRAEFYEVRYNSINGVIVELYPRPTGGTYTIYYVNEHPGLINDAALWLGPARSDELVITRVAMKGLLNESMDQDAAVMEGRYTSLLAKVQNQVWQDGRNSAKIRDVIGRPVVDAFDYPVLGPGSRWY